MRLDLKLAFKIMLISLLDFFESTLWRIKTWRIALNRNISIATTTVISPTARVDTNMGGRIEIGKNTEILDGVLLLTYGGNIIIGNRCSINPYTIIYGHGNTLIGDDVLIAGGCMIIPSNHIYEDPKKSINKQGEKSVGIVIENDVWIGHGCSILDGVNIGRGSVVAAGSVVNRSIPPMSVAAGCPVRIIKSRNEERS